jgi:ribosomal protein L29
MKKLKLLTLCVSALSVECFGYKCDFCKNYHREGYECSVPVIVENDRAQILNVYGGDEDDVITKIMWDLEDKKYARWSTPTWTCVPFETLSKAELAAFLRKLMLGKPDKADKGPSAEELGQYLEKLRAENHAERFSFVLRQFRSAVDSVQRELARLADDGEEKIIKQNAEIWFRFSLRSLYLSTFIRAYDETGLPKALEQESPLRTALVDFINIETI